MAMDSPLLTERRMLRRPSTRPILLGGIVLFIFVYLGLFFLFLYIWVGLFFLYLYISVLLFFLYLYILVGLFFFIKPAREARGPEGPAR